MTAAQKNLILSKISCLFQPTNLQPYIPSIIAMMERVDLPHKQTSALIDAIFTIHANYRLYGSYEPYKFEQENINAYKTIQNILKNNMIPQTCEICNVGEDSLKIDGRRVCQDCVTRIKAKVKN
jgi:hypothetical protein